MSLIEVLIAVVLLGIGVSAVLTSLRTSTKASSIDEEHAVAFSWLQAASDEIYRTARISCTAMTADSIRANYEIVARNPGFTPDGWNINDLDVTSVEFLGRASFDDPYEWDAGYCLEGTGFEGAQQYTQRVSLQVTTPLGITKTLQMVKGK